MHQGDVLREFLKKRVPASMSEIATIMDMTPQNLNHHLRKEVMEGNFLRTLKDLAGIGKNENGFYIIENKFEAAVANEPPPKYNRMKVTVHEPEAGTPIYDIVARGGSGSTESQVEEIPSYWLKVPGYEDCTFGMYVFGHSMYPTIENGSLILCREILDKSEIRGGFIIKNMQKTDGNAAIPILPLTREILEKYNYKLRAISSKNLNIYIKEVGKLAGIDSLVKIITYPGGIKKETIYPKYELMTTKMGRKTLVSMMISNNIHERKIRSITGHKKALNLEPYSGIDRDEVAVDLANAFK